MLLVGIFVLLCIITLVLVLELHHRIFAILKYTIHVLLPSNLVFFFIVLKMYCAIKKIIDIVITIFIGLKFNNLIGSFIGDNFTLTV
jgi:hypothetical protein